jgi:hypothetical protein
MSSKSLSIDLGTATTQHGTLLERHSRWMASAAALPPRPPTTNSMSIFQRSARGGRGVAATNPQRYSCSAPARHMKHERVEHGRIGEAQAAAHTRLRMQHRTPAAPHPSA